jgi:hypothetical protein
MFYDDHAPPHFHARHGEHQASLSMSGELLEGLLPFAALRDVRAWARLHSAELQENWERARINRPLVRIWGLR